MMMTAAACQCSTSGNVMSTSVVVVVVYVGAARGWSSLNQWKFVDTGSQTCAWLCSLAACVTPASSVYDAIHIHQHCSAH